MKTLVTTTTLLVALFFNSNSNAQVQTTQVNTVTVSIEKDEDAININWSTMREANTSYFITQKSTDGTHFINIATKTAFGGSLFPRAYETEDICDTDTVIFYRVVLVLMGGERVISAPVEYNKPFVPAIDTVGNSIAKK